MTHTLFNCLMSATLFAASIIGAPALMQSGTAAAQTWAENQSQEAYDYRMEMLHPDSNYNRSRRATEDASRSAESSSGAGWGLIFLIAAGAVICAATETCSSAASGSE